MDQYTVAALYHFTSLKADEELKERMRAVCEDAGICGSLLLANEGINGTIAGSREGVDQVLDYLKTIPGFSQLEHKESRATKKPFRRLRIRLRPEIVTMGIDGVDPGKTVGHYIDPQDWNELIRSKDVVTIDTRNVYEIRIGQFEGAINPQTQNFRDFPAWLREFRKERPNTKFAMYCTGGIRCEKATSLARDEGIDDVYHLKGGILKYLEDIPEDQSLWQGECYVFDRRISLKHGLEEGSYIMCQACGEPLSRAEAQKPEYKDGRACPICR